MFVLCSDIKINGKRFKGVNNVEIKRSISSLIGTAKITVPTTAVLKQTDGSRLRVQTANKVKRGDKVEIQLGYNGKLRKEFSGYVSRVNYTTPLEIECEDAGFLLREKSIAKSYSNKTLDDVLKDLVEGTGIKYDTGGLNINIKYLLLATETGSEVSRDTALKHVLSRYGLVGYFDTSGALFVGLRQGKEGKTVKYKFGWNTVKENELKYHNKEEQQVKIKAVYVDELGTLTEANIGDCNGATRTVFLPDIENKNQLEVLAQNELSKYKFDGFAGKFTGFLQPFAEPGDLIDITDPKYSDRSGVYYCAGTTVKYGMNGGRRIVEIGGKTIT